MTDKYKRTALFFAVVSLVAIVIGLVSMRAPDRASGSDSRSVQEGDESLSYHFSPGETLTYAVELEQQSTVTLGLDQDFGQAKPARLEGALALRGSLALTPVAVDERGTTTLSVRWVRFAPSRWVVAGQDVAGNQAIIDDFLATEARVLIDSDGRLRDFSYEESAVPTFASTTELVLRTFVGRLGSGKSWTTVGHTGAGVAVTTTSRTSRDGQDVLDIERDGATYTSLEIAPGRFSDAEGSAAGNLSMKDGRLWRSTIDESLVAYHGDVQLVAMSLTGTMSYAGTHQTQIETAWRGVPRLELVSDAQRNALVGRIAGLTMEDVEEQFRLYGRGGRFVDHDRFLWRARGLVELRPELAERFVDLYQAEDMTHEGRAVILDILAPVGHAQAQAAMRRVLSDPIHQTDPGYAMLLQRFVVVADPTSETLDFLAELSDDGPTEHARFGAVSSYGAAIGRLTQTDPGAARARSASIADKLAEADNPVATRAYLGALGNTRMAEHVDTIARFADPVVTTDPSVRMAAADALEHNRGPHAADRLVAIVATEPVENVQQVAIWALLEHRLSIPQLDALARAAASNPALLPESAQAIIQLCEAMPRRHRNIDREAIAGVLVALLGRRDLSPRVRNHAERALRATGS